MSPYAIPLIFYVSAVGIIVFGWLGRNSPGFEQQAPRIVRAAIRQVIFGAIATVLIALAHP